MPPKTPDKLKEQLERQNEQPAEKGKSKSAEGMEVLTPTRGDFNSRDSHFGTQCSGTKSSLSLSQKAHLSAVPATVANLSTCHPRHLMSSKSS